MRIVLWVQKTRCKIFLCGSFGINITKSWFKPRQTNIDPWWCRCSWRPPWPNGRLCAISLRCLTRLYQATTNYYQPQATANYCKLPIHKNSALLLCARIVFYCTTTTPPCVCLCAQDVCSPLRKPFMSPDPRPPLQCHCTWETPNVIFFHFCSTQVFLGFNQDGEEVHC